MIRIHANHVEFDADEEARLEVLELLADRADPSFWLDAYFASFGESIGA